MFKTKINAANAKEYYQKGYWTEKTLLQRWNESVSKYGDKLFVTDDIGRSRSYAQLDSEADAVAAHMEGCGISLGDVVSFQITPRYEFLAVLFGCIKLGAVPAPLGMCFVGDELTRLLEKLGSKMHFSVSSYRGQDTASGVLALRESYDSRLKLVFIDGRHEGAGCFANIISAGGTPTHYSMAGSDDVALILCTSGTTKGSKAALYTHNNVIFSEEVFNKAYSLTEEDTIFMPAPLNHATGLHHGIISPMLRGGRVVLQERFDCKAAVELMNREKCTYSMGATPFIYDLLRSLEESGKSIPSLKFYISGGAPVPRALVRKAYKLHNIFVCECYGSTESVPHVGVRPAECLENDGVSAGRAMDGIEVRIVDENRRPLPPGVKGEEASRGPNMFAGYLGAPELTDESLDDEGWFYSGDLAVMDEKGNVSIVGRIKDMIIRGGENLNSNLINDNLEGCPGVFDHAVIGAPDERLGERICAFVVTKNGAEVSKESIVEYLRHKRVQKRLWPERVETIDEIPRTESGKVKKNLLSDELARRMEMKG